MRLTVEYLWSNFSCCLQVCGSELQNKFDIAAVHRTLFCLMDSNDIVNIIFKLTINFFHVVQWRKKIFDFVKQLWNSGLQRKAYSLTNISQKSIQFNKYLTTFTIFPLERLSNRHPSTFQKENYRRVFCSPLEGVSDKTFVILI